MLTINDGQSLACALQWRTGFSARTLAHAWEAAAGLPTEIERILSQALGPLELLLAVPERKTLLPGGSRDSQSDVFVLLRHSGGTATCTIEGKVEEPFGPTIEEWSIQASPGKIERLTSICDMFGWKSCPNHVHYQLLHRTAAALIEAERFAASHACMIVHSFSPQQSWFDAFREFVRLFGADAEIGTPASIQLPAGKQLVLGWAGGDLAFLQR